MTNPDSIANIIARDDWRQEMADYDRQSTERLNEAYQRLLPEMRSSADALVRDITSLAGTDENPTVNQVRSLETYISFMATIDGEMSGFSDVLSDEVSRSQEAGVLAGIDGALRTVITAAGDAGVITGIWNRPDPASVANAIGYVDGSAMRRNLRIFGDNAVNNISDLIIAGVAQGRNPQAIAQIISDWTTVPYSWALNMTRTTQIYSARMATHTAYNSNPRVVQGWVWMSALDRRTCISCWSKHGSYHEAPEVLNDHHQGRCTPVPVVRGRTWYQTYEQGPSRFERLPESEQREIFHNNRLFEAYQRGEVGWQDFSEPYQNDVFGEMLRAASYTSIQRRMG